MSSQLKDPDATFYFKTTLRRIEDNLPELRQWVDGLQSEQLDINFDLYEEVRNHIGDIIWIAINLLDGLKELSDDIDLPEPGPIAGARLKRRLSLTIPEKDKIVRIVLASASQILRSDFDTVSDLSGEITDLCEEYIKESAV